MSGSHFLSAAMLQLLAAYMVVVMVPGPVAIATGSLASLHGLRQTVPLLLGFGVGRAVLTALMAGGATQLTAILSLSTAKVTVALVLCYMAWRTLRLAAAPTAGQTRIITAGLFAEGVLVGFLSPQVASVLAFAFLGLSLNIRNVADILILAMLAAALCVAWHLVIAILCSRPTIRTVAFRCHRPLCVVGSAVLGTTAALTIFFS